MSVRSIAKQLNVSPTTVSLALKGSSRVSPQMREKIKKLAEETGYTPNARLSELMNEVRSSREPGFHSTIAAFSLFPQKNPWTQENYEHLEQVFEGARKTAERQGYKLELIWLNAPNMSPRRFKQILEARSIKGIYCLGSLDPDAPLPNELSNFALVGHATSVDAQIHRVRSYFSLDCLTLLENLSERGYKKIGMLIKDSGDRRTNYSYTSAFAGFYERANAENPVPILRLEEWNKRTFTSWFEANHPDAIMIHHEPSVTLSVESNLLKRGLRIPGDIGIATLDKAPSPRYSGVVQNHERNGAQAIEMLIGSIHMNEFQLPPNPKVQLIPGVWNEGKTIRKTQSR